MENKNKTSMGITLIALVITIIVLIILVGAVINILLGENNIIAKAKEAAKEYNSKAEEENNLMEIDLNVLDDSADDREKSRLPNEYQEVEYIEYTGSQYINTGYYPDKYTNAKYKVMIKSLANFGPHLLSSKNFYFPLIRGSGIGKILARKSGTEFTSNDLIPEEGKIYEIEAYPEGKIIVNNEVYGTIDITSEDKDTTTLLLGTYGGDPLVSTYLLKGNMYYCQIYDKDILVRDFIPCYRKIDGEIGMYDLINNVFYTNVRTEKFLKGNDV